MFDLPQDRSIRVSWKHELRSRLTRIFAGGPFVPLLAELGEIHRRVLHGRVFVALHMHAGDGNVHTNIPVNSDDYEMLQAANRAVGRTIRVACELVASPPRGCEGRWRLTRMTHLKMRDFVLPGQSLALMAELLATSDETARVGLTARVGERTVATARVEFEAPGESR